VKLFGRANLLSIIKPLKNVKGTHFQTVDDVKIKTAELLKRLTESDWQHCFQEWPLHMQ